MRGAILTVAAKELKDGFRDKRAIYTILFGTLFGPLMLGFLLYQLAGEQRSAEEIQIPVVGQELAPVLVKWLNQQSGVEVVAGPADPEKAVKDRKVPLVLVIKKEFAGKFSDSHPAPVQLYSDSTRSSTRAKVKRVQALLRGFSGETGALRLIARGVSPEVASGLKVEDVEVSNAQQRAAEIISFLPMFLILAALTVGMQIATDSTAGERERGSLEPLLLNPVPRFQLIAGKWLAASAVSAGGMVASLVIITGLISKLPLEDLGFRIHLDPGQIALVLVALLPLALMGPAVMVYLACFAKSFKEAQSYMGFLIAAVTIPGVLSNFYPLTNRPWLQPIPIIGQFALGDEILAGNLPAPYMFVAAWITVLAVTAALLVLAERQLSNERIIFER
jgi:sodium transport system permease protein